MGWFDDAWNTTKTVGKGITKAADVATDTLIDKDAWINTVKAAADGPGGKTVKASDLMNMALDSTMLIPGVGLAGGAARVGVRAAGKVAAKEAAEALAKKEAKTLLRSPLNNAVRSKASTTGEKLVGKVISSGGKTGARRAEGQVVTKGASGGARRAGSKETSNQIKRMALKQEKGIGKKVGFGQTKRRILVNSLLTGGANLGARGYDEGWWGPTPGGVPGGASDGDGSATTVGGGTGGYGAGYGAPGSMYIIGADGDQQPLPEGFAAALAAFMKQNGTVDGSQVIYNK